MIFSFDRVFGPQGGARGCVAARYARGTRRHSACWVLSFRVIKLMQISLTFTINSTSTSHKLHILLRIVVGCLGFKELNLVFFASVSLGHQLDSVKGVG